MADLEKLYQELSALTLLEAAELKKMLEERWGVTAAAPVAFAGPMPGAGAGAAAAPEPVEEQTEFTVILKEAGPNKIPIIKVVRQLTNLGLKEAKDVVESAPATLLEAVSKEVAMDAKSKLEAEGGKAEIK